MSNTLTLIEDGINGTAFVNKHVFNTADTSTSVREANDVHYGIVSAGSVKVTNPNGVSVTLTPSSAMADVNYIGADAGEYTVESSAGTVLYVIGAIGAEHYENFKINPESFKNFSQGQSSIITNENDVVTTCIYVLEGSISIDGQSIPVGTCATRPGKSIVFDANVDNTRIYGFTI